MEKKVGILLIQRHGKQFVLDYNYVLDNNEEKEYYIVSICGLRAEFHPSKVEIRVRVPADALFVILEEGEYVSRGKGIIKDNKNTEINK